MTILKRLLVLALFLSNVAWISESGSGVVSDAEVIVRTSLEATEVLRSNTLSLLRGESQFGGSTNYSSTDSGGVFSTRNVTSSIDVMLFGNNDFTAWLTSTGASRHMGLSEDDTFVLPVSTNVMGHAHHIIATDATTFVASNANIFTTSRNTTPTKIATITGASDYQLITIIGGSDENATSIDATAVFLLKGDIRLSKDDVLVLRASPDGTFVEEGRASTSSAVTFDHVQVDGVETFANFTIPADATTFSAIKGHIFTTSTNTVPTKITAITGTRTNQILYIFGGSDSFGTSFDDGAVFKLTSDIRLSQDDSLVLRTSDDGNFVEISRSDN